MDIRLVLGWAMLTVPGVLPTLGRSKVALYIFATLAAIVPLSWQVVAFVASDGMSRMFAASLVGYTSVVWALGLAVAIWQRIESDRGTKWARFPIPTLTTLLAIGGFNLLFIWGYS